jgi:hypothetical protein
MIRCFHGTTNKATKKFNQDGQLQTRRDMAEVTVWVQAFNSTCYENIPWSVVGRALHQRRNLQLKYRVCDTVLPALGVLDNGGMMTTRGNTWHWKKILL